MSIQRIVALVLTGALTACSGPAQQAASPPPGGAGPSAAPAPAGTSPAGPDAAAIFASFKTDPTFVKVNAAPIKSGPHIGDVDIYVDKANADKFKAVGAMAPDGMTVVKASLEAGSKRAYIMKKIKGYDPANNDWYYANTKADGTIEMTGRPQMCISCHAGFKATDYLAAPASENAKAQLK